MKKLIDITYLLVPFGLGLSLTSQAQWTLVEDFETDFTEGSTVDGINGWVADDDSRATAVADPLGGDNGTVLFSLRGGRNDIYKPLGVEIADGTTGTLYFEVYLDTDDEDDTANVSYGLSDLAAPDGFGGFNPQMRLLGNIISPRDGNSFNDTAFEFESGVWLQFWIVADNASDTFDAYLASPSGSTGQVQVADDLTFRGGATAEALISFYTVATNGQSNFIDNIYVDINGENLSLPTFRDDDEDMLNDIQEELFTSQIGTANLTDLTTPWDGTSSGPGSGDFDGDGISDFDELNIGLNPVSTDTDGDTFLDNEELAGTTNAFDGTPTNAALADSDGDGLSDLEENGSANTAFGNAATNPNEADTDGDGITDGYEVANNTAGTALDPNDDGSTDSSQGPDGDRDLDGLTNLEEFDPSTSLVSVRPQTRADLADTDGDTLSDFVEDNFQSWESATATGTNPTVPDSDGDGLDDADENLDLDFSSGSIPTNSDPNLSDTDGDGFGDLAEVTAGTDPDDSTSVPAQPTGFNLVEDFEGTGMVIGSTFNGVNGWTTTAPEIAVVADEPIEGGDQVGSLDRQFISSGTTLYRSLNALGLQGQPDATSTLFFQVFAPINEVDHSFGFSDVEAPNSFGNFEAQTVLVDSVIRVRDAGAFRDVGTFPVAAWMNVWVVADNATDQVTVYYESPLGETGQVEVTGDDGGDPFDFRNGTEEALTTLLVILSGGNGTSGLVLVDNFYVDPSSENLTTPAAAKPVGEVPVDSSIEITSVTRNPAGDLLVTFTPGGDSGFVLTSASPLELETGTFTEQADATYDGIDTFTVPAAFVTANPTYFLRVEAVE